MTATGPAGGVGRVLTAVLLVALVASLAGVVYVSVTPTGTEDPYTGFYLLGDQGNASNYPLDLSTGETGSVTVGVVNREHEEHTYTVVVRLDDETIDRRETTVPDGATRRESFDVTPASTGRQRLLFHLYEGTDPDLDAEPYRRAQLWITVDS